MKFTFQNVGVKGARLGLVTDLGRHADRVFETPLCFLYTKRGCVPHLTSIVLEKVLSGQSGTALVLPLPGLASFQDTIEKYGKGLGQFIQLENHLLYASVQDPAVTTPSGYNDKAGISFWSTKGRLQLNANKFMAIQKAFKPDIYQALCDSDAGKDSTKKRTRKAVERSLELLDSCIGKHSECPELKQTAIFGTVQGGHDLELREKSARQTAERPVAGFVIDGFNNYGPETETMQFDEIKSILQDTLSHLPKDKPRLMHSVWRPDNLLEALESGIDLFDASYPYLLAERGSAFTLPLNDFLPAARRPEVELQEGATQLEAFQLTLGETRFSDDFLPISNRCTCYTCRKFTRAYINHLLSTSEMLAQVLLSIHNLHHYLLFFEVIRITLKDDTFEKLKSHVLSCGRC